MTFNEASHDGVAEMLATIDERREAQAKKKTTVVILKDPTEMTDNVEISEDGPLVDGANGYFSYTFDHDSDEEVFIDVTYSSGDPRPVVFTVGDDVLGNDFCTDETGGWNSESCVNVRYGPFSIPSNPTLKVSTDNGFFPGIHEIRVIDVSEAGDEVTSHSTYAGRCNWIVPPSQSMRDNLANSLDFCFVETTQDPDPDFIPDPDFYNAINADGLWICASKQVDERVLQRAAELVCRYIPIEIRRLFALWRAPLDMPRGPFRLVILDPETNQQAGDCPDFPDTWGGRNGTSNPGCFTSAEDFPLKDDDDSDDVPQGALTVHEMTHAIDMVVRQQLDPYFMQQVDDCFNTIAENHVYKKAYAAADRHEYLAEICTLFVGCNPDNFLNGCAGCTTAESGYCDFPAHQDLPPGKCEVEFRLKSDLIANDPGGYELLKSFLIELTDGDDDTFWWRSARNE